MRNITSELYIAFVPCVGGLLTRASSATESSDSSAAVVAAVAVSLLDAALVP
jgi:hypothetical protein